MKEKYIHAFMDMAERFGETSEATRLKVGALIVKNDMVISIGVNGTPSKYTTNKCENSDGETEWFVRHAEAAALDKLAKSTESSEGSSMFISHSPCKFCALRIVDAGISSVYYRHQYRDLSGIDYLKQSGVTVSVIN